MASISLEKMRQYGRQNTNMLPQCVYGEPFNSSWLLHSSYPWLRQRPQEHEPQQYYTMPVHLPPLPSQQTPLHPQQPRLQTQNPLLQPTTACQASSSPAH
ncbi:LOW QUALITY PROTEIN: ameloblastin [Cariama cristata]